ncbi:MAG: phytoene/squalene synthase family protein [Crocinitomicaceae bacterium]|nr:phytoene/squalene synthase family protein [Crocinitomicaceae bacterium]MBK8925053.1 phytoene/squalene synthase family protein [Crocinitomicaceae bacterium]
MKKLFDEHSTLSAQLVTKKYSTSFYAGVRCLDKKIRNDVHAIYGFVRFADEIVDTFHDYDKEVLLSEFIRDTWLAIDRGISLNPILNAFQATVRKYEIDHQLITQFLHSMQMDLEKISYTDERYKEYILGSAEVVGLMCLKVFVYGNQQEYDRLKPYAMTLGSAFQKINFLRDLKDDVNGLGRLYFPHIASTEQLTPEEKLAIELEIEEEFKEAYKGIIQLPKSSRFGVYLSYVYYTRLLKEIKRCTINELMQSRISVPNNTKWYLFLKSLVRNTANLI